MQAIRSHPRIVLVAIAILAVLGQYTIWGKLFYRYLVIGPALIVHAGVLLLLLAVTSTLLGRFSLQADTRGMAVTLLSLLLLYPVAVGFMWYDVVVTPPAYTTPEVTLRELAINRLGLVSLLTPLAAGYALGAVGTSSSDRAWLFRGAAAALAVAGPVLAFGVALVQGLHPGFTGLFYGLIGVGSLPGTILLYLIARWEQYPRQTAVGSTPTE